MLLYHETARANLASILKNGVRDDGPQPYAPGHRYGVYVADVPPRFRSGRDWVRIAIDADLSEPQLAPYAYNVASWPPHGNTYREWCIPARVLNGFPRYEATD